eukprot:CAMPEP_0184542288 /NCGR_PEP_ID=MMETSP0199_2-20130426/1884_1 /TAXON_ID=1112570 /ORGANISM="Thraustochytrium sp., Strain LLF1b" /LENGTH=261 /DNA_ID=CAMNT_0026936059 /DNA_START=82 /DNA_END=867 /DNA_ORIENTATION=-
MSSDDKMVEISAAELERLREVERMYKTRTEVSDDHKPTGAWVPGETQASPFKGEHVALDPADLTTSYNLMISMVIPRPIAFVSTMAEDGVTNLAPFSYFACVGHSPPMLAIGFAGNKDSLVNVKATGELCVNIIGEWMVDSANFTCGNFAPEFDEFSCGFSKVPCFKIKPPRVAQSASSMECVVKDLLPYGTGTVALVEVVQFHVQEELLDTSRSAPVMRFEGYKPMCRLGGNDYGLVTDPFTLARPTDEQAEAFDRTIKK